MPDEDIVRSMIQHENQLVNHRVTWMSTFQGLLIAAVALVWGENDGPALVYVLGGLGFSVSLLTLIALCGATFAQHRLLEWWKKAKPFGYTGPGVTGLSLARTRLFRFMLPWNLISLLFMVAWILICFVNASRAG